MVARPLCEGLSTAGQAQRRDGGQARGKDNGRAGREGKGKEGAGKAGSEPKKGVGSFQGRCRGQCGTCGVSGKRAGEHTWSSGGGVVDEEGKRRSGQEEEEVGGNWPLKSVEEVRSEWLQSDLANGAKIDADGCYQQKLCGTR